MVALSNIGKKYDIKVTVNKTKVIRVCRDGSKREGCSVINITIDGHNITIIEQVNQFRY